MDPLRTSVLGVASPEPCTRVWAYSRHLLLCARSERFSPLVEQALRTTRLPLDPGDRIPRVLLERGTPSPWNWLSWRLLDPEGRRQRPVAEKHPVGAVQRRIEQSPWGEAANLQANAYRERIVVSWAPSEAHGLHGYARRIRGNEVVRQDKAELPAVLRFDPLPVPRSGWYLARVDVHGRTFDRVVVLVHELAHILLGHFERPLGTRSAAASGSTVRTSAVRCWRSRRRASATWSRSAAVRAAAWFAQEVGAGGMDVRRRPGCARAAHRPAQTVCTLYLLPIAAVLSF